MLEGMTGALGQNLLISSLSLFGLAPTPSIQFVKPPPRAAFSSALFFCLGALVCFVETRGCVVKKCHPAQEVCEPTTAGVLQKCWQALAVHDTCH